MGSSMPTSATSWDPLSAEDVAALFDSSSVRWWLSGGAAIDRWAGGRIRERENTDISTLIRDLPALVEQLPSHLSTWISDDGDFLRFAPGPCDADPQPIMVLDEVRGVWVLQINIEDGTDRVWVYKRDPRLQVPWDRAVLDLDGIPTGAPEVQLVWKALRPRPEDDTDKEAVLPRLSSEARAWWEKAILTIHPHSSWSIHVRSPLSPAKASWERSKG